MVEPSNDTRTRTSRSDGLAVLLHAAGSSPRALSSLSQRLETSLGRALTPNLPPGVERSLAESGAPFAHHVEIAKAAIEQGQAGPTLLFGHSFGGLVGLLALLDGVEVEAAVLYEPIVVASLDPSDSSDRRARTWDRDLVDFLARCVEAGDPEPGVARFVEAYNEVAWSTLPEAPRRALIANAGEMATLTQAVHHCEVDLEAVRTVTAPVLILCGGNSPKAAQRMATRLAAFLPNGVLQTLAGLGHMGPVLAADVVADTIDDFLAA